MGPLGPGDGVSGWETWEENKRDGPVSAEVVMTTGRSVKAVARAEWAIMLFQKRLASGKVSGALVKGGRPSCTYPSREPS